jgi:hypothetical protein
VEEKHWDDMDALRQLQGNAIFFIGDPPTNPEGHFKNFSICLGTSFSNFAPNKRKSKNPAVQAATKPNMKLNGWLSQNLRNRLVPSAGQGERAPITRDLVQDLLADARRHVFQDGKAKVRAGCKAEAAEEDAKPRVRLSPEGIVREVALGIQKEKDEIVFDYLGVHEQCWTLLGSIRDRVVGILGGPGAISKFIPDDSKLPFVVGLALAAVAGKKGLGLPGDKSMPPSMALLEASAEVLGEILDAGRGRAVLESAAAEVDPEDVQGLELGFDPEKAWGWTG